MDVVESLEVAEAALAFLRRKYRIERDDQVLEGIAQDAVLALLHRQSEDEVAYPRAYLRATVRNLLFKRLRHRATLEEVPIPPDFAIPPEFIVGPVPESVAPAGDTFDSSNDPRAEVVRDFLRQLPKSVRLVAELRVIHRLHRSEIAQRLGLGDATVRKYCTRAADRLLDMEWQDDEVKRAVIRQLTPQRASANTLADDS